MSKQADHALRIFMSYGHDTYLEDAQRIKSDLEARGHTVWFDLERLETGHDWGARIEEELLHCDLMLLLMTPHSVRRRNRHDPASYDGFCLNEIAKALENNRLIVPVLLAELDDGPPISICRIQYLDMRDAVPIARRESRYDAHFNRLVQALEKGELDFEGGQARLIRLLKPLDFRAETSRHLGRFTGREWLLTEIDDWLDEKPDSRIFLLTGPPGIGKTALAVRLGEKREVIGRHFCVHGHDDKGDPRRALLSIIYQLAQQLPEYDRRLQRLDIEAEVTKNARTIFDNLIVGPLSADFPAPDGPRLVVVDALDEVTDSDQNEIARLIANGWSKTPTWLRLFITSRPESAVLDTLAALDPYVLDAQREENLDDLRGFLAAELSIQGETANQDSIRKILDRSEGIFLYLNIILEELELGRLTLDRIDEFPRGLSGHYERFFARQFPDQVGYQSRQRPTIEMIIAAREPIPVHLIQDAMKWDEYQLRIELNPLGSLFPRFDNAIRPFHKTIVEWLTSTSAGPYCVSLREGHRRIADICTRETDRDLTLISRYCLSHLPSHLVELERWEDLLSLVLAPRLAFISNWIQEGEARGLTYLIGLAEFLDRLDGSDLDCAGISTQIGRMYSLHGEHDQAEKWLEKALNMTTWKHGRRIKAVALHELGSLRLYQSDTPHATQLYRRALRLCMWGWPVHHDEAAANLVGLASVARAERRYAAVIRFAQRAVHQARRGGDIQHEVAAKRLIGAVYNTLGKLQEARVSLEDAIELCDRHGEHLEKGRALLVLGNCHYRASIVQGYPSHDARVCYEQAFEEAKRVHDKYCELESQLALGLHALGRGDNDVARSLFESISTVIPTDRHLELRVGVNFGFAALVQQSGNLTTAMKCYEDVFDQLNSGFQGSGQGWRCRVLVALGATHWHLQAPDQARQFWNLALQESEKISLEERNLTTLRIGHCQVNANAAPP